MTNPLRTPEDYELYIYTLAEQFSSIRRSTNEKLFWYDSQPHPDDDGLASTDPHHKHIPPDIKHHRIPAPQLNFIHPNLPVLIREIEELIETLPRSHS